jgi:hypothetical protein
MNGENQSLIERFGTFFSRVFDLWNETLEHVRTIRAYTTRDTQTVVSDGITISGTKTTDSLTVPDFAKYHVVHIRYFKQFSALTLVDTDITVEAFRNEQMVSKFTISPACFVVGAIYDADEVSMLICSKVELYGRFNKLKFTVASVLTDFKIQIVSYT